MDILKSLYIIDSEITTLELKNINLNNLFLPNNKITHLYIDNCTIPTITPTATGAIICYSLILIF